MKKIKITLLLFSVILTSCIDKKPEKYKYVVSVSNTVKTYPVTVTEHSNHAIKRGAGGALIGGIIGHVTGIGAIKSAVAGGLVGASTSDGETSKTYTKMETDVIYKIAFSDSSVVYQVDYCHYSVGDSTIIFNNNF